MAKQVINIGSAPSAGDGDPIRISFDKVNQNFTELYTVYDSLSGGVPVTTVAGKTGNVILTVSDVAGAASQGYVQNAIAGATPGLVQAPATSKGAVGDVIGMYAVSASYFYYCTANYTTGTADIWQRVASSGTTW